MSSTPYMVQFQGKYGRMPTKENSETIVCPLYDCKLTAKGQEAHVKVRGDSFAYQITQETYMAIRSAQAKNSTIIMA